MNKYKIIVFYLLILLAIGCGTVKKNLHTVSTRVSDTLVVKTEVIKAPLLTSTLIIEELCDSITSEPKPFQQTFVVGEDKVSVKIVDNELLFKIEQLEKEILRRDSVETTSSKEVIDVTKKVTVRYRWARITWVFLSIIVIFVAFPKVPQSVRNIVEKLIIGRV